MDPTPDPMLRIAQSLRPMTTSEVGDSALRLYRNHAGNILPLTFHSALLIYLAYVMLTAVVVPESQLTQDATNIGAQVGEFYTAVGVGLVVVLPVLFIGLSLMVTLTAHALSATFRGEPIVRREILRRADRDLPRTLVAVARSVLLTFSGLLVSLVPIGLSAWAASTGRADGRALSGFFIMLGILLTSAAFLYFLVREALTPIVSTIEGLSARDAGRRGLMLVSGRPGVPDAKAMLFGKAVQVGFFTWLATRLVSLVVELTGYPPMLRALLGSEWWVEFVMKFVLDLPIFLAVWLVIPLWATTLTLIYYERRVRHEGYDIELLHANLLGSDAR